MSNVQIRNISSAYQSGMTRAVISVRDCNGLVGENTLTINFSSVSSTAATTKATTATAKAATTALGAVGGGAITSQDAAGSGKGGNSVEYGNGNAEETPAAAQAETYTTPNGETLSRTVSSPVVAITDKKWPANCRLTIAVIFLVFLLAGIAFCVYNWKNRSNIHNVI